MNPRATYYAEAWGNKYNFKNYDSVLPEFISGPINSPADLEKIGTVNPTGGVFAEQIELVKLVKQGIGGAHFLQTVFSPLSVLAFLVARPAQHTIEQAVQAQYDGLRKAMQENPRGVHAALKNIATTLAQYSAANVEAGASGLFFAIVKLARQGVLTESEYAEFGTPYDLQVLEAVQGAPFNLLHVCGAYAYLDALQDYPMHALNWASVGQHNSTVGQESKRTKEAVVGGVDELGVLQTGTPDQVIAEAQTAIRETNGRHLLLTPGCGTNVDVPEANLRALRQAAERVPVTA